MIRTRVNMVEHVNRRQLTQDTPATVLTTRQATVPLQVSGMHLVHSLDGGRVPCRKVNAHCHVRAQDILAYYREIDLVVACARD